MMFWKQRKTITHITTNPAHGISPKRQKQTRFAFHGPFRWFRF